VIFDAYNNVRVVSMVAPSAIPGNGSGREFPPAYNPGTGAWTRAFDARPYAKAYIIVTSVSCVAGMTLDVKLQKAETLGTKGAPFDTWVNIPGAVFDQIDSTKTAQTFVATVDLSQHQNAVGVHLTSTGTTTAPELAVYAILFPYDTSNAGVEGLVTHVFNV
jgi:hypothetical protein